MIWIVQAMGVKFSILKNVSVRCRTTLYIFNEPADCSLHFRRVGTLNVDRHRRLDRWNWNGNVCRQLWLFTNKPDWLVALGMLTFPSHIENSYKFTENYYGKLIERTFKPKRQHIETIRLNFNRVQLHFIFQFQALIETFLLQTTWNAIIKAVIM